MSNIFSHFLKGISPEKLINNLKIDYIDIVVDVRFTTWMPMFYRPKEIKPLLENEGIRYIYLKDLGNPTELRKKAEKESIIPYKNNISLKKKIQLFEKTFPNKHAIWRGIETIAFKEWEYQKQIDVKMRDELTKLYYLNYLFEYKEEYVSELRKLIKNNLNKNFSIVCSCNTEDKDKCHRFWLIDLLEINTLISY